ncbi:MAG: 3-dehydroquinate synthase family protein [Planctomycetota bacterium]
MTDLYKTVPIDLPGRSYPVVIGAGALHVLGEQVQAQAGSRSVLLAHDAGLPAGVVESARDSLARVGIRVNSTEAVASEVEKSMASVDRLVGMAAEARLDRNDAVVSLGGGIVCDVAGFAAAVYRRGIAHVACPTTLLAMVDASVGGKTGVNLPTSTGLKKNRVGAFWQPRAVIADVSTLASLDERVHRAGLAECLKHTLICRTLGLEDHAMLGWIGSQISAIMRADGDVSTELVERNVRIKAAAVLADERERDRGLRMLLNLGHSFGHALETRADLSPSGNAADAPLQHGEAVALGLVCAAAASVAMGRMGDADFERIREAIAGVGLPTSVQGLPSDEVILEAMNHDKKVLGGDLRLILPVSDDSGLGLAEIVVGPPEEVVRYGIGAIRGE